MKLTQFQRDAFVQAAMNDVPTEDYRQQARDLLQAHFLKIADPKLQAVYNSPDLRSHLSTTWIAVGGLSANIYFADKGKVPSELQKRVSALMDRQKAQDSRIASLRHNLRSTVNGISTRKRLVETLPEFEKYAPAEFDVTTNLPAVANVVTDFVKAGWPKGKKQRAALAKAQSGNA